MIKQLIPHPVALLRDEKGIYGIGLSDEYLQADLPNDLIGYDGRLKDIKLILRPDRITEACGNYAPILQKLPRRRHFRETLESELRDEMVRVMHHRAGISHGFADANQRRAFYGMPIKAARILNWVIGQVIPVADPEALRVARRFTIRRRWWIYSAGIRNPRALQLAESFPFLAYLIYINERGDDEQQEKRKATSAMVDHGARLREIAAIWELPAVLRRIKPGAVHLVFGLLRARPELLSHMPEPLPQMRRWLRAVKYAQGQGGDDYAAWIARNWSEIRGQEIADLADWIKASRRHADAQADQQLENWIQQHAPAHLAER
jgi:hypothetical protein